MQRNHEQNRHWCFTSFMKFGGKLLLPQKGEGVRYICWQIELTAGGNAHVQGYVELEDETSSIRAVQAKISLISAHMEVCKDVVACIAYTMKGPSSVPGTWTEDGERKVQGSNEGNIEKIQTTMLNGGDRLDCYKIVGSSQFTAGADRVRGAIHQKLAKIINRKEVGFKNKRELNKAINGVFKMGRSVYIHRGESFDKKINYNYDGEDVFVVYNTEAWYDSPWRTYFNRESIWLPRKGLSDIALCAKEIWYSESDENGIEIEMDMVEDYGKIIYGYLERTVLTYNDMKLVMEYVL